MGLGWGLRIYLPVRQVSGCCWCCWPGTKLGEPLAGRRSWKGSCAIMLGNSLLKLAPKGCAPGNQTGSNFFLNLQKLDAKSDSIKHHEKLSVLPKENYIKNISLWWWLKTSSATGLLLSKVFLPLLSASDSSLRWWPGRISECLVEQLYEVVLALRIKQGC